MALAGWPLPLPAMTVEEAVAIGLERHPEMAAASAEIRAARTEVNVAKGGYLPSVTLSGGP